MTELERAVLECATAYRTAYKAWMRAKNSPDVDVRLDANEKLLAAERTLLHMAGRER